MKPEDTKSAALAFESGHVCRVCESQVMRMPGGSYHWCPTCGAETTKAVQEICTCGSMVGKHDAQLRCLTVTNWEAEPSPLIRRKVRVGIKEVAPIAAHRPTTSRQPVLFNKED